MFPYAKVFSNVEKTGKEISNFQLKVIDEVDSSNVLQVITDNAANCKAAGKEIEKVHKHIFWSPCVVDTLRMIFKDFDVVAFLWMSDTYIKGEEIVKYFINHSYAYCISRTHSGLELLKDAKTRFKSHHILLKRLKQCREALVTTIFVRSWKDWLNSNDERTKKLGREVTTTIENERVWDEIDNILTITKPIYQMIKCTDGKGQKIERHKKRWII